jgi:hypothetical protein
MIQYRTYNDAKEFLLDKNINSQREYFKYVTGRTYELRLPGNPRKFYKVSFKGWGDLLSNNRVSLQDKKFYSYNDLCELVRNNNILSKRKYQIFYKNSKDIFIPSNPDKTYNEWKSWEEFLGKCKKNFLNFYSARNIARELNISSARDYEIYIRNKNISFLPSTPDKVYKNEWVSWMDWLNTNNIPKRISRGSIKVKEFLINNNITFIEEKSFESCKNINKLPFDFYLDKLNICIEFDGIQHFKSIDRFGGLTAFEKQQHRDFIKNKYCDDNNIKLLRIPYWEMDNIESILKKELKNELI